MHSKLLVLFRFSFGLLLLIAITAQFLTFRQTPLNYFSYFTVISNLLVAYVFFASVFPQISCRHLPLVRGASVLYIILTGFGFLVLLGGHNVEFLGWTNLVLHYFSPLIVTIDWIALPSPKIPYKSALYWILFLLIYLAYSMIRGSITGWYPYGFLNPAEVSINVVVTYVSIITFGTMFLSYVLIKSTILLSSRRQAPQL